MQTLASGYRGGPQFKYSGWSCFNKYFVQAPKVGRCRLPVSKPELKARLLSALETEM